MVKLGIIGGSGLEDPKILKDVLGFRPSLKSTLKAIFMMIAVPSIVINGEICRMSAFANKEEIAKKIESLLDSSGQTKPIAELRQIPIEGFSQTAALLQADGGSNLHDPQPTDPVAPRPAVLSSSAPRPIDSDARRRGPHRDTR